MVFFHADFADCADVCFANGYALLGKAIRATITLNTPIYSGRTIFAIHAIGTLLSHAPRMVNLRHLRHLRKKQLPMYVCVPVDGVVWVHLAYGASLRTYTGYVPTLLSYVCREYCSSFAKQTYAKSTYTESG